MYVCMYVCMHALYIYAHHQCQISLPGRWYLFNLQPMMYIMALVRPDLSTDQIWVFPKTPKSSILIGFSIINHPFWGYPYSWKHPFECGKLRKICTVTVMHGKISQVCMMESDSSE